MFEYQRTTHFYETDLMGIVHHSNYLRFCEEARVAWCIEKKILSRDGKSGFGLAVVETHVRHLSPIRYADQVSIFMQAKADKARVVFQYFMKVAGRDVARVETTHCRLDENFKVLRLSETMMAVLKEEKWIEI